MWAFWVFQLADKVSSSAGFLFVKLAGLCLTQSLCSGAVLAFLHVSGASGCAVFNSSPRKAAAVVVSDREESREVDIALAKYGPGNLVPLRQEPGDDSCLCVIRTVRSGIRV